MALNLNDFRSQAAHSTLPTHTFETIFTLPAGVIGEGQDLLLRTEQALLPGVAFFSVDNFSPYGNGKMYNIPYRYLPQEISMTHIVDAEGFTIRLLQDWAQQIADKTGASKFGAKYMFGPEGYAVDIDINVLDRQHKRVKQIKLIEAFPQVIEPIQLGWGQTDEYMKLNVQYRFTRYEVDADTFTPVGAFG